MLQSQMEPPQALQDIYDDYTAELAKVWSAAPKTAGLFGIGADPRNHPCNSLFYEKTGQWAAGFVCSGPKPEEAEACVDWILFAAARHREEKTYWYFYAAQKHAAGLIPLLSAEASERMRRDFREQYRKADWAPVQREIYDLLTRQAGNMVSAGSGSRPAFWHSLFGGRQSREEKKAHNPTSR